MENQNEGLDNPIEENNIQNSSKNEELLNDNQNNKEVNIKITTNNISFKEIQQNISNNDNEEVAVNKMNIENEQQENNLEEQKNDITENIQEGNENKKERTSLIRYPLAKIKNIMKLDNDIKLCQKDAYLVLGKLTEMFLQELARDAYAVCKSCKRKTINLEDINSAIKMEPKMGFINFNSIFYVQELNKVKKSSMSAKKNERKIKEKINEENEKNLNDNQEIQPKEKKKRGKTGTKEKIKGSFNNLTLDSMFGKNN
jgi:DNA polymerase epsilon subunit 4